MRGDEALTSTHLDRPEEITVEDLAERIDECRRFVGEAFLRLEKRIAAEYAMVRSTVHQHGEKISGFLVAHEVCQAAQERARAEAEHRLAELQERLNHHVSVENLYYPPRPHRDSEAIEASLRVGRKVKVWRSVACGLVICAVIFALGYAARQLRQGGFYGTSNVVKK